VGTSSTSGVSALSVFTRTDSGLSPLGTYPLSDPVSTIEFSDFGDTGPDAAFLAGSQVFILRSSTMQLAAVSVPASATAMAVGSFIYVRKGSAEIALLGTD
jgi:hypothetical protein